VLEAYPQIAEVLAPAFALLDVDTLRRLNEKIAIEGREARLVARAFLRAHGLLA
jgi:osmoprotectant transport system substrate-binding protein